MVIGIYLILYAWIIHYADGKMNFNELLSRSKTLLSLTSLSLNRSELSIASVRYNPTESRSDFIDYVFGGKAVHIDTNFREFRSTSLKLDVFDEKYDHFQELVRSRVNASRYLQRPKCSLELLGYSRLEIHEPFTARKRLEEPAMGYADLALIELYGFGDLHVDCIYRSLYEHWLPENPDFGPNYWSTVFFCPMKMKACNSIRKHDGAFGNPSFKFQLNMTVDAAANITWTADFQAKLRPLYLEPLNKFPSVAVCTVIPYASMDEEKIVANAAIFNAWIEYYLHLGFAVIVYDRDGETYRQSVNHSYDFLQSQVNSTYLKNLIYNDFTILTKLHPQENNAPNEESLQLSRESFRLHRRRWRTSKLHPTRYIVMLSA
jgi:hypothetical protein